MHYFCLNINDIIFNFHNEKVMKILINNQIFAGFGMLIIKHKILLDNMSSIIMFLKLKFWWTLKVFE